VGRVAYPSHDEHSRGERPAMASRFPIPFLLGILLGLVWMGPAWWNRRILYALPLWDGAVILAWAIDLRRLPRPARNYRLSRWREPLSLNVDSKWNWK